MEKARWLSTRQNDLIEITIEKLLNGENLGKASEVWMRIRRSIIAKITNSIEAVIHFIIDYGDQFIEELNELNWKRLALSCEISA
jgi:SAM-dependent MidA family methyltransferase